jgi:hypothetical protein
MRAGALPLKCGGALASPSAAPDRDPFGPAVRVSDSARPDLPPCRLILVERPEGWVPTSELDAPRSALVIDVVQDCVGDMLTFVRQYNAVSMDEQGTTWAAFTRAAPKLGESVELSEYWLPPCG